MRTSRSKMDYMKNKRRREEMRTDQPSTSERRYPVFKIVEDGSSNSFECIPCEDFAEKFPPLKKYASKLERNKETENEQAGPSTSNASGPSTSTAPEPSTSTASGPSTSTVDADPSDETELPEENPFLEYNIDFWQECCRDPSLKKIMDEMLETDWSDDSIFYKEPIVTLNDPDASIAFLCSNPTISSFLAAASTVVNESLAGRIVRNFPCLMSDLICKPEDELQHFLRYFEPEEFTSMASALMDQYEETNSFVGPLCSTEVATLMMAQNMNSGNTKF